MKSIRRLLTGGYLAMMGVILFLLLFVADGLEFFLKRRFLLLHPQMLGIGLVVLALILLIARWANDHGRHKALSSPAAWMIELACWGVVFVAQVAFCYFTYFLTDWDVGIIVRNAFDLAKYNNPMFLESSYFSHNPNNVLIVEIFAAIIRAFCLVAGDPGLDRCVLIILFVQCVINTWTGFMLRRIALRLTRSRAFSIAVAIVYIGFVGLSPWLMIPYTDSMSLFVPVLCLFLYQRQGESHHKAAHWICIGMASALGYLLKPQAVIMTIAIVIWETLRLFAEKKVRTWCVTIGSMLLVMYIGIGPLNSMLQQRSLLGVDVSKSNGMMHFFMMGMNAETRGTFSNDDLIATIYMPDDERSSIQIQKGIERIRNMGVDGFLELMRDKTLINYADGTFAWGINGIFFAEMIEDKDDVISPFLKSVFYCNGEHYPLYSTGLQCIWVAMLMCGLLLPLACRALRGTGRQDQMMVMMLSIIGLTVFEWIFEAKARYLYIYAPVYLLMGMAGLWYTLAWLAGRFRAGKAET